MLIIISLSFFPLLSDDHGIVDKDFTKNIEKPRLSSDAPNSKPLRIYQFATTSNSFFPSILPADAHFTLAEGWTSNNVTIYYEGVSVKKDIALNGEFSDNSSDWMYMSNNPAIFTDAGWKLGHIGFDLIDGDVLKDEYAFYQQNLSISEPFNYGNLASLSIDYKYEITPLTIIPENLTLYLAIKVNDKEVNKTLSFLNLITDEWATTNFIFDPLTKGQILPGNVSIKAGVYALSNLSLTGNNDAFKIDNIKFEIWTEPNEPDLVEVLDINFNTNYTYHNLTYGRGYSFIDTERIKNVTSEISFTIFQNITNVLEFQINNITVNSDLVKTYNSTYNGKEGSLYSTNSQIHWELEFLVLFPFLYQTSRIEVEKPSDWNIESVFDGFGTDQIGVCQGTDLGSNLVIVPYDIITQGIWKIEATSVNYITECSIAVWNGTSFEDSTSLTYGDKFQVQAKLNNTLTLDGTTINCTIRYPNGSIFSGQSLPASLNTVFGNYTVDHRMGVGDYEVVVVWTNNASYIERDKVGFKNTDVIIWHHTNLQAVNLYFEAIAGDPLLVKVNFTDSDIGGFIDFAIIAYNTTFGSKGIGAYLGSGIYYIDLDTSSLDLGDYYISFNASKTYYQNQTAINLIQIKIIAEPLALQLPRTILIAEANSFINVQVNVTGYITGNYLSSANISSNWQNNYTIIDFNNGTWVFNLSTFNLPTSGIPEFYTITFMANKTDYGNTMDSLILRIDPIPTVANINQSIFQVYPEKEFSLELNYTVESSGEAIQGANISITWPSTYNYSPTPNGFLISFNTTGLTTDLYTIYIELNQEAYETAFTVVYVMIIPAETQLTLLNSEPIEIIKGDKLNISCLYTSDGQNLLNSTLYLIGNINGTFLWDGLRFYCTVNTQNLGLKSHLIQILATGQNYEPQLRDLIITIFPLEIEIQISSTTFTLEQGQNNKVDFTIYDKSHDSILTGFNVSYEYNGISYSLNPILEGSYQLDLDALNLNPFRAYHQIKITVLNPYGDEESITIVVYTSIFGIFGTILTISIISIVSVAALVIVGIFINKRYLGLSKFQRKIRTVKRRLEKQKFDKINEPSRAGIIKNLLNEKYSGSKTLFNGKIKNFNFNLKRKGR
jgi:hypothetical protein